jgi:hypothetical protein
VSPLASDSAASTPELASAARFAELKVMELRSQFGTETSSLISVPAVVAFLFIALTVGCESSPSGPSSFIANVGGTWVSEMTTMVLDQNGSTVTGTWSRVDESQTTSGVVSGDVARDQFRIQAELVTRYSGSANPCATVAIVVGGVLTVSEDSLSGVLTSVRQPPCILRPSSSQSMWRRVTR